jgi:hypothetical protein
MEANMTDKVVDNTGGGEPCSDKDAATCLAQGHPKAGSVPVAWNQKDQNEAGQKFTGR